MAELTNEDWEAANERGRIVFETEPHAKTARADRASGMIVLELFNGCTLSVPARHLQGLGQATDDQLAEVEITGVGYGLHWETLDADFTVPGLANGQFGSAKFMEAPRARLRSILAGLLDGHEGAIAAE
jgi:hypothetical protein